MNVSISAYSHPASLSPWLADCSLVDMLGVNFRYPSVTFGAKRSLLTPAIFAHWKTLRHAPRSRIGRLPGKNEGIMQDLMRNRPTFLSPMGAGRPSPSTPAPKPQTLSPQPQTPNPKPQTPNPKLSTLNPQL